MSKQSEVQLGKKIITDIGNELESKNDAKKETQVKDGIFKRCWNFLTAGSEYPTREIKQVSRSQLSLLFATGTIVFTFGFITKFTIKPKHGELLQDTVINTFYNHNLALVALALVALTTLLYQAAKWCSNRDKQSSVKAYIKERTLAFATDVFMFLYGLICVLLIAMAMKASAVSALIGFYIDVFSAIAFVAAALFGTIAFRVQFLMEYPQENKAYKRKAVRVLLIPMALAIGFIIYRAM